MDVCLNVHLWVYLSLTGNANASRLCVHLLSSAVCVCEREWIPRPMNSMRSEFGRKSDTFWKKRRHSGRKSDTFWKRRRHFNADSCRTKLTTADGQWDLHSTYLGEWKHIIQWNAACNRCSVLLRIRRFCKVERTVNKSSIDSIVSLGKLHLLRCLDCTAVKLQPATRLQVSRKSWEASAEKDSLDTCSYRGNFGLF